jgi:hypothetical protein
VTKEDEDSNNASMGVNEVTSTEDPGKEEEESNAAAAEKKKKEEEESAKKDSDNALPICKGCNFVFESKEALEKHEASTQRLLRLQGTFFMPPAHGRHSRTLLALT